MRLPLEHLGKPRDRHRPFPHHVCRRGRAAYRDGDGRYRPALWRILTARGARILPIPANYYDDLEAKWGLGDARIAELRALNLLYDCDEAGEFLHAYTETFDDRFFFEIVQRIGGYQQYGAVNAAVRMAAQAQRHLSLRLSGLLT